jgi:hypothetical protein
MGKNSNHSCNFYCPGPYQQNNAMMECASCAHQQFIRLLGHQTLESNDDQADTLTMFVVDQSYTIWRPGAIKAHAS